MSKNVVLIHGSWQGGWAWDAVVQHLAAKGFGKLAPTLPGHGPGASRAGVAHRSCTEAVVAQIESAGLTDVVLVGHSFGGSVVQTVAQRIPERVSGLVFVNAFVLADGECVFDNVPSDYVALFEALAAASPDDSMLLPWEIWRNNFIQDASEEIARTFWQRLSPEPNQVNRERLMLKDFYQLSVPKCVIHCRQDRSLPQGTFHPRMSARLGAFRLLEIDGSHQVMFTRPAELAEAIIAATTEEVCK